MTKVLIFIDQVSHNYRGPTLPSAAWQGRPLGRCRWFTGVAAASTARSAEMVSSRGRAMLTRSYAFSGVGSVWWPRRKPPSWCSLFIVLKGEGALALPVDVAGCASLLCLTRAEASFSSFASEIEAQLLA